MKAREQSEHQSSPASGTVIKEFMSEGSFRKLGQTSPKSRHVSVWQDTCLRSGK